MKAPIPSNEEKRLKLLWKLKLLDTDPEECFDRITKSAIEKLHVPISTISLIDKDREWYKSCQGLDIKELPRNISFCAHSIMSSEIMIVEDTIKDPRFADNPQVTRSPYIRFYAGVPLHDFESGLVLGVLCIKDIIPRKLSKHQISILFDLASQAEQELHNHIERIKSTNGQ